MSFSPGNVEIWVFLGPECVGSLSKINQEAFTASRRARLHEIIIRTFPIQMRGKANMIAIGDWIRKIRFFRSDWAFGSYLTEWDRKSAVGNFLYLGAWRRGKHPQIDLGET